MSVTGICSKGAGACASPVMPSKTPILFVPMAVPPFPRTRERERSLSLPIPAWVGASDGVSSCDNSALSRDLEIRAGAPCAWTHGSGLSRRVSVVGL